jgi:hypothetical protein
MTETELSVTKWRKSTRSNGSAQCVEVGQAPARVAVRDTQDRQGPAIAFPSSAWEAFTAAVRADSAL